MTIREDVKKNLIVCRYMEKFVPKKHLIERNKSLFGKFFTFQTVLYKELL